MDRSGDDTRLASTLGFGNLRFCAHPWSGGGNLGAAAVLLADAAVCTGQATNVVVFRSIDQGRGGRFGQARSTAPAAGEMAHLSPFGAAAPVVRNALLVREVPARPRRSRPRRWPRSAWPPTPTRSATRGPSCTAGR